MADLTLLTMFWPGYAGYALMYILVSVSLLYCHHMMQVQAQATIQHSSVMIPVSITSTTQPFLGINESPE